MTDKEIFIEELKVKTKNIAVRTIKLSQSLPNSREANIIAKQIIRSATSIGANYRAACRARSKAEFFAKLSIVIEEADETQYWFEILSETNIIEKNKIELLKKDLDSIVAILTTARKSVSNSKNT